jgi:phospholipid-binding lipoprotein MlaA
LFHLTGVNDVALIDMPTPLGHLRRVANIRAALLTGALGAAMVAAPALAQAPPPSPSAPIPSAVTTLPPAPRDAQIPDPWARTNRGVYKFSMALDRAIFAPVIHVYLHVVPQPVRDALHHAIQNLDEPRTAGNDILQGHFHKAGTATARFAINSTFGLVGLIDVAGRSGIPRHESDFGETLGRYGAGSGPYVFVPFAGPSSVRDGIGRLIDIFGDPVSAVAGSFNTTFGEVRTGVAVVDARASVDDQMQALNRQFTDPYATIRSAYSQQRAALIGAARGETPANAVQDLPDFGPDSGAAPAAPPVGAPAVSPPPADASPAPPAPPAS